MGHTLGGMKVPSTETVRAGCAVTFASMSTLSDAEVDPQLTEVLKRFALLFNVTGSIWNVLSALAAGKPRCDSGARREPGIWMSVAAPGTLAACIAKFTLPTLNLRESLKQENFRKSNMAHLDQSTASKFVSIASALTTGGFPSRRTKRVLIKEGIDWSSGTQNFETRAKALAPHCRV